MDSHGEVAAARVLLGARAGASVAEVQAAFRVRVRQLHPDTGGCGDPGQLTAVRRARDLLLSVAGPERRRRRRTAADRRAGRAVLGLRRSTWDLPGDDAPPQVDTRL